MAANFLPVFNALAAQRPDLKIRTSSGSSGLLFAQITNGAPYHLFLSADQAKPAALRRMGLAQARYVTTYARGNLAFATNDTASADWLEYLRGGRYVHLALANPQTAPYGQAAVQTLQHLGLFEHTRAKWVLGENVAQTLQFVVSGNAEAGFVALSHVQSGSQPVRFWPVPPTMHAPINQDGALLAPQYEPAQRLWSYLLSCDAARLMETFGYTAASSC